MIFDILKLLASPVTEYFGRKQDIKAAQHQVAIARIKSNEKAAGSLDLESIKTRGWKDDYLLIITTLPVLIIFIEPLFVAFNSYINGSMTDAVLNSFKVLELAPEYYWYSLAIVYIDTFGFRRMFRTAIEGFLKSKFGGSI